MDERLHIQYPDVQHQMEFCDKKLRSRATSRIKTRAIRPLHDICSRARYTEDRRAGTVQFQVDVVGSIQNQIMKTKRHIKQEMAKKRENEQTMSNLMLEGINRRTAGHGRRLALYRQRLQTRGLAETETPELDENGS